jgi:hypothetical protein
MRMSDETWRLKVVHHKTNVWGGAVIRAVSYILMEGDRRIGAFDTEEIGERIVREHNDALSAREPAGGEVERLRAAMLHAADTMEREAQRAGWLTWTEASIIAKDLRYEANRAALAAPRAGEGEGERD